MQKLAIFALLLVVRSGVVQAQTCSTPDAPLRPVIATHTIPPYPPVSVMTHEQGATMMEVEIGPDGTPTGVKTITSSGSVRLDEAALDFVKSNWRWQAPVKNCQAVASKTRVSVNWNLRDAPVTNFIPLNPQLLLAALTFYPVPEKDFPKDLKDVQGNRVTGLIVVTDKEGHVTPTVVSSSGVPDLDNKALDLAKGYHWTVAQMEGKPVGSAQFIMMLWTPPGERRPNLNGVSGMTGSGWVPQNFFPPPSPPSAGAR